MKKLMAAVFVGLLTISGYLAAKNPGMSVELSLSKLTAQLIGERTRDEVYLGLTVFKAGKMSSQLRKPTHPKCWAFKKGDSISDVRVWKGKIKEGEAVELVVALVEQDLSVFNPDDLIGSVKLVVRNRGGRLSTDWTRPNINKPLKSSDSRNKSSTEATLKESHGIYRMELAVQKVK